MKKNIINVAILFYGLFPWNRGIGQLYSMVEELGHKPVVFSAYPENRYLKDCENNYRSYYLRRSNSVIGKLIAFQVPINIYWQFWLMKMCRRQKIDFLFVRETPLSYVAQRVARKLKIPVVLDMRENLPATYADNRSRKIPLPGVLQYRLASLFESMVLPGYDYILAVSNELARLVITKYGIPEDRISVLGNYPDSSFLDSAREYGIRVKKIKKDRLKLVFAGSVSEDRGVQDIVSALSMIPEDSRPHFTIIGEGDYLSVIKSDVRRLKLDKCVEFQPLLPPEELPAKLAEFDIGVCPYWLNEQTHHTMPGKLFEYMASGLAVLSSARKPVRRVVEENRCGVIYSSNSTLEIADAINKISSNVKLVRDMGHRGKEAIFKHYNYQANLHVLKSVLKTNSKKRR